MYNFFAKSIFVSAMLCCSAFCQVSICNAQIFCQDTTLINPYFPCFIEYNPVCACNGVTYRNFCFAELKNGILPGYYTPGVCGEFGIDIVPNPPVQNSNILQLGIYVYEPGNVEVFISDVFGVNVYTRTLRNYQFTPNLPLQIDTSNFEEGVYIVVVVFRNRFQTEKFTVVK